MGEPKRGDRFYFLLISPQILIPALMVTAEKDFVLTPEMSKHMEDWVREQSCSGSSGLPGRGLRCPRGCRVGCSGKPLA